MWTDNKRTKKRKRDLQREINLPSKVNYNVEELNVKIIEANQFIYKT